MKEIKYFYEYLNNENPFAFLKGYDKNKFLDKRTKKRLESIQMMQPKFISCGIDPNILSKEHNYAMNTIIKDAINQEIHKGVQILMKHGVEFDTAEFQQIGSGQAQTTPTDFCGVGFDTKHKEYNFKLIRLDNILWIFKRYSALNGMEDVIIGIYRLKLLNKQNVIRNKVYDAIKDNLDEDIIAGIDFDKPVTEESTQDAQRHIGLDKKKGVYD